MKFIELKANHTDDRGQITDLISGESVNAVTLVTFISGAVRANHYHKKTIQWNYVIKGKVLLITKTADGEQQRRVLKKGDFVATLPMEQHALRAMTNAEVLIITKGPRSGDNYEADTFRLDEPLI